MGRERWRVQGTGFAEAVKDRVAVGTSVALVDTGMRVAEGFTILVAWATDLTRHIMSYLSITGAALVGRTVGDEVDLPTEESNITRRVKVTGITKAEVP